MKGFVAFFLRGLFLAPLIVSAATVYVSPTSPSDGPGTAWSNAFHTIQAAVDAAVPNDTVLVTNGVYDTGGAPQLGTTQTNRVMINKSIVVKSVSGPEKTLIVGAGPLGNSAIRCAYVGADAVLSGFMLTNGYTFTSGYYHAKDGGGVICQGSGSISNCVVVNSHAYTGGGGAWGGHYFDCIFSNNIANQNGGGVFDGVLINCLVVGNQAEYGGGINAGSAMGCTICSNESEYAGGGCAWSDVTNCVIRENLSRKDAGGIYHGTAVNGILSANVAFEDGGGSWSSELESCTVVSNRSFGLGGGVYDGEIRNCIVYYNRSRNESTDNLAEVKQVSYSCVTPLSSSGNGNISDQPALQSLRTPRLVNSSSCINAGTNMAWMAGASDIEGDARISGGMVDMGADEVILGAQTGAISVDIVAEWINAVAGQSLRFEADIEGDVEGYTWHWGDGTTTDDRCVCEHAYNHAGTYSVILVADNKTDVAASTTTVSVVSSCNTYVSPTGKHIPPYASWTDAATNIQAAVDASLLGGTVWVEEGDYSTGKKIMWGSVYNRVAVDHPVSVIAVGEAKWTRILGSTSSNGSPVRCVMLCDGAVLSGFTLSNGATGKGGDLLDGGGVWSEYDGLVSNCIISACDGKIGVGAAGGRLVDCEISGNFGSNGYGGGVANARLENCTVSGNYAYEGGGIFNCTAKNCQLVGNFTGDYGGGAYRSTLQECTVSQNEASKGGGLHACTAQNCLISENRADYGGGVGDSLLEGCTIIGNTAFEGGGAYYSRADDLTSLRNCTVVGNKASGLGGGVYGGTIYNSIVYYNFAMMKGDNIEIEERGKCEHTCSLPLMPGAGNISACPRLSGYHVPHIGTYSPCIDAGTNMDWMASATDIDGEPRISGIRVDMGADEYVGSALTGDPQSSMIYESTYAVCGFPLRFRADCRGKVKWLAWVWDDGTTNNGGGLVEHAFSAPGDYTVALRARNNSGLDVATTTVHVVAGYTNYVALSGSHVYPYNSWATASTNLQSAVDVNPYAGGLVLVADGTYSIGGRTMGNGVGNRIAIRSPLTVKSLNGAAYAKISGSDSIGEPVRCAYVCNRGRLDGFTLKYGETMDGGGIRTLQVNGGGAYCEPEGRLSHCLIKECNAQKYGGGVYQGRILDSLIYSNGAYNSGGGAKYAALIHCTVLDNGFSDVDRSAMTNVIVGSINKQGGVWSNLAQYVCIARTGSGSSSWGVETIEADPLFQNRSNHDYQLTDASPCIDSGKNIPVVADDLQGVPRPLDGDDDDLARWDRGCYEFSSDSADTDGDTASDWNEYVAGTNPLNSNNFFQITAFSKTENSATLTFDSSVRRIYRLVWCTNLTEKTKWKWHPVNNWRLGIGGLDTLMDETNRADAVFYRLEVNFPR